MSYRAFLVESLGAPRNHQAIFVELDENSGTGTGYHVTGNIQAGMAYEVKTSHRPEDSDTFLQKSLLGRVEAADCHRVDEVCRAIDPPKKQFEGAKRLYPKEPLRRCQEWTREAIQMLKHDGILKVETTEGHCGLPEQAGLHNG